ncbi:hypothetical protein IMG5_060530 [Ichthyophthirius multifiliis]|uniref:B30.2/SPRY domain-containing protein n=1 Tax=Ichthyophthirius multifiliis TaxID=5932 RepID=G0QNP1_ICHMU|nr:hypothetical protein IMG5_060530 [Ichthyophthirius multifiliis]EGR33160.1 hypothetical protein IMG5_060530 [Ichthyophthirius multifiliis]|eukprot:XP_004037146.1 hypothetical protein IMG5_060530 [Ichthyophthirius multifiliis]
MNNNEEEANNQDQLRNKIKIFSPTIAQQTANESSGQRFAIVQPNFDLSYKQKWGFKINKLVGWIGVGICHVNVLAGFQYNFKYTDVGHGSYLVSGNGYTWSHYKSENNSASKSFSFATGDIIYGEFDPINKVVKFVKNKTLENYTLEIDLKLGDEIAPCVNLCSINDEVEIIQNSSELDLIQF